MVMMMAFWGTTVEAGLGERALCFGWRLSSGVPSGMCSAIKPLLGLVWFLTELNVYLSGS